MARIQAAGLSQREQQKRELELAELALQRRKLELALESLVLSVQSNGGDLRYQKGVATKRALLASTRESLDRLNELDSGLSDTLERLETDIEVLTANFPRDAIVARLFTMCRGCAAKATPPFEGLKGVLDRFRNLVSGLIQVSDAVDELYQLEKELGMHSNGGKGNGSKSKAG